MVMNNQVDCIVRFHDPSRLHELSRCIFSLASQQHQPVQIILITQNFSFADTEALHHIADPIIRGAPLCRIKILNLAAEGDARSKLINLGISSCHGRFLGFLD
jgi:hypothetical protein